MRKIFTISTIILLLVTNVFLLFNILDLSSDALSEECVEPVDENIVATKTDNSKLVFIEPHYSTIELVFNDTDFNNFMSLGINGDSTIMAVSASYTKKYHWSVFDHTLIAGNHVSNGCFYEGYECLENTGAFIYANNHWLFINRDVDKRIYEVSGISDACAFAQTMLVHEGKVQQIPNTLPS